jgi:hypothetical protein
MAVFILVGDDLADLISQKKGPFYYSTNTVIDVVRLMDDELGTDVGVKDRPRPGNDEQHPPRHGVPGSLT